MPTPRLLMVCILAALAPGMALAGGASVTTGAYENTLMIGFNPATGVVSGYFDMVQDGPPVITCAFYLKGRMTGASMAIDTYYPDDPAGDLIKGRLSVKGPHTVEITLPTDHGGCGNVWPFANPDSPSDFDLDAAQPWTAVRVVKSAKAYFYAAPGAATHGRAYLVASDGVGVRASQSGWVQGDYVGGKRTVAGWLKESDLYPGP